MSRVKIAFGDDLDAGLARNFRAEPHPQAHGLADAFAERLRHALGGGARGEPARFQHQDAAVFRAQGSLASTSGTRVVLPAPGGATSTAALFARKAAVSSGNAASIGSGDKSTVSSKAVLIRSEPLYIGDHAHCTKNVTEGAKARSRAAAKPAAAAKPLKKGDHVFLVDGSGYIFRAYHALPPINRKSDGLQLNAVFGFCNMLWKLLRDMKPEERPTHLAVVFDKSEKTFRTEMYPDYKAHRPGSAGRSAPAIRVDPRSGARLRSAVPRAGRLRGRRSDRDLCARGLRGRRHRPPSSRRTRT